MKIANVLKKGNAWIVSLALLVGLFSVLAATTMFGVSEEAPTPEKFVANFSDLGEILKEDGKEAAFNSGSDAYKTAYTRLGDTSTTDGKLNTWMSNRFAFRTNYTESATRAWFSQGDFLLLGEDVYNGNSRLAVSNGVLRHQLSGGNWVGEMLRRLDTVIPQYNGTDVNLKNFEAKLTFKLGMSNFKGGFVFGFHEATAGTFVTADGRKYKHTGNTLVIGNGAGNGVAGKDGWAFYAYDAGNPYVSATTIDATVNDASDMAATDGVRFDRTLDDQKYTLTVRVVGGTATFTLTSEDGSFTQTMSKAVNANADGGVSFGVSNRDTHFYSFEITELNEQGNAVDYGTHHNGGVKTFNVDFTNLQDAHYNNGSYKVDSNYTAYSNVDGTASVAGVGNEYAVNVKAAALADYLESKFDFYVYAFNGGDVIERWNAAGYVVDAQGNHMTGGYGNNGKEPSTGNAGVSWMPGNGIQGGYSYQYPTMKLNGNKWLQLMNDWNANWVEPFQVVSYMKVKNEDGTDAVLKNFKLEMDFKLATASATTYPQNQSPLFVKFGGYEGVTRSGAEGAMFAVSHGGGYFLNDLNTPVNNSNFLNTLASNGAPYYTENAGTQINEAHLTLTVKNGTVNAVITAGGTEILNATKNNIAIQSGLIQIGTSYAGIYHGMPYFGAIEITRLDENGDAVDFDAESDTTFEASFVGLTDYREGYYYSNNGTKNNSILTGKVTQSWLTKAADANFYQFGANDTALNNYLTEKFTFYHIAHDGNVYEMAKPYQNTQEVLNDQFTGGGYYWSLCEGRWLRAQPQTVNTWGELFRKQVLLVPKFDGEQLAVSDFTASFNLKHHSAGNDVANSYFPGDAITFTFHSSEVARVTGAGRTYGDAVTLVFTRQELVIYDGRNVDFSWQDLIADEGRVAWSNGNADAAHVELKVVKNKMDLKVTSLDGSIVYYEVTGKQLSHKDTPGYLYLGVANSAAAFADIQITPIYRNDTPAPDGLVGGMKTIFGFIAGNSYEYKLASETTWTAVPAGTTTLGGLAGGTYEVRLVGSKYCAASPAVQVTVRDTNITPGDGTAQRFEADFAQPAIQAQGKFDANGYYVPTQDDTAVNSYITDRFGMFYNNNMRHADERAWLGQGSDQLESDPWGGVSYWRLEQNGMLQRYSTVVGGEMMRKAEVLTLKAPNGNFATLKNFVAEYTVVDDHQKGAIALSFRSADYNHVLCTDGYYANQTQLVFENQEVVIIGKDDAGKHGITMGSGDVHGRKDNGPNGEIVNTLRYVNTEIAALANHNEYTVTVKALGDQLTVVIKATDNSVIWDNTADPFTLERGDAGYMALSITNAHKGVKGLVVTQLDDEGNPVDFGTGTRQPAGYYDASNTVYYDFSDESQMNDFDTYFLPEWSNLRKPLIETTNTQYNNWYVKNGSLHFKETELYRDPTTLAGGVEIGGTEWKHAIDWMVPYTGNLGVAVLNTRTYENFILEVDFTGHQLWTQFGFGAGNTADAVYHSNENGGCNLALAWNAGSKTASSHFFYPQGGGYKQVDFNEQFAYNDRGTHHLTLIVSDKKLYVSLDGSDPVTYDVPADYDGGYLYFTHNNPVVVLDNIRIVDLDAKDVLLTDCAAEVPDQVIDRSNGDRFTVPSSTSYGVDAHGYEYPVFITLNNDDYRSYKDGDFDFKIGMQPIHGLSLSDTYRGTVSVTNNIAGEFDTESSRKYYFDHPNDFLDFGAYYSEQRFDKDFWNGTAESRKQNGTDEYWSGYKGELVEAENVTDKWQINGDGTITNAFYKVKGGAAPTERLKDYTTLVLTDQNLLNFRVEVDIQMGDSWWYNCIGVGIQDPTAMYYALSKGYNSTADGGNTGFKTTDLTKKGGAWLFMEQEGYLNSTGNFDGGLSERFTTELDGYDFIKNYDKKAWHHFTVEVVDGIMSVQIDDSMTYYLVLDSNAIGGYVGIGSYGNKSLFKNFQLTALNNDGNEVPMDEAESGFGASDNIPEFVGWNVFKKLWDFDWLKKHTD